MDSYQEYNESQLIRVIQIGRPNEANDAFGQLYNFNDPSLRKFLAYGRGLQEFEIDDVCAMVWERSHNLIAHYVPKGIPYLAWVKGAAVNVIREGWRRQKQEKSHTVPMAEDFDVADDATWTHPLLRLLESEEEEEAIQRRQEIHDVLGQLLEELPSEYRDVIEARHEMELSPNDTAELLGWESKKVHYTYYRVIHRLKVMLLERYELTEMAGWLGKSPEELRSCARN